MQDSSNAGGLQNGLNSGYGPATSVAIAAAMLAACATPDAWHAWKASRLVWCKPTHAYGSMVLEIAHALMEACQLDGCM